MTDNEYLERVLADQDLADDSAELKELQGHRRDVEKLLREESSDSSPTIRYGGSKAKGTLIKEYYDLDLVCYFPHDETGCGETLKAIYDNVRDALKEKYDVQEKTSAIRLRSKEATTFGKDFHIDVVPGRYVDASKGDCFLHQTQGDKERLKTNLQTHIDHIKDSGVVDAIRLMKLWKVRRGLRVKQFVFELLIIKLLAKKKAASLADQLKQVWKEIAEAEDPICVEDPANPAGNDLMPALRDGTWSQLSAAATNTLSALDTSGWESIFGSAKKISESARVTGLKAAAAAVSRPTRPFGVDE
jgi:tRNA nucleotidyltransferase (CCA-adding enzyme)